MALRANHQMKSEAIAEALESLRHPANSDTGDGDFYRLAILSLLWEQGVRAGMTAAHKMSMKAMREAK